MVGGGGEEGFEQVGGRWLGGGGEEMGEGMRGGRLKEEGERRNEETPQDHKTPKTKKREILSQERESLGGLV